MRGGSLRPSTLPAGVALIHHPRLGPGLFDTGYSRRFLDATRAFPERCYRWLTPPILLPGSSAVEQLVQRGIAADDVRWIVLSHLHADHIAGLIDFPRATIYLHGDARAALRQHGRWGNLLRGVLPALLPDDLDRRTHLLASADFTAVGPGGLPGHDLAGDGQLVLVPLPGHADGQLGLVVRPPNARPLFLIADAAWTSTALVENRLPSRLSHWLNASTAGYHATFASLRRLAVDAPDLRLVPSHCPACWLSP